MKPGVSEHGYTVFEERIHTLTAAVGLLVSLAYLPFLFQAASAGSAQPRLLLGAIIFAAALIILYGASTTYHALPTGEQKRKIRILDHCAIFILIAGTYTPLIVGPLWTRQGLLLLGLEWGLALTGILLKVFGGERFRRVTDLIYVVMGWLGIFWMRAFAEETSWLALYWVLGGGVVYTIGIIFYKMKHRPYTHGIWHLFVFAGTVCHAYAIWKYAY
jgi:hemolysin III